MDPEGAKLETVAAVDATLNRTRKKLLRAMYGNYYLAESVCTTTEDHRLQGPSLPQALNRKNKIGWNGRDFTVALVV